MFNYDWFHGAAYRQQCEEAKRRCLVIRFPDAKTGDEKELSSRREFLEKIEIRTLIYLRDGFSYEIKEFADAESKSHLVFECEPVDDQYKIGAFVVTMPFDEIVRVEVFAVHSEDKPPDALHITGFRSQPDQGESGPSETTPHRPSR